MVYVDVDSELRQYAYRELLRRPVLEPIVGEYGRGAEDDLCPWSSPSRTRGWELVHQVDLKTC